MNKLAPLGLAIILHFSTISHAVESTDDLLRQMEMQNRETQQRIENERLRSQSAIDRLGVETERLRMQSEAYEAARKQRELAERAEQAAQEREESAQKAEEAAEEIRAHLLQAEIKYKNLIFLGVVFLTISIFLWSVVKKYREERVMKDFEKFGIVTTLVSGLLILLVLMISQPWVQHFDFIQNFMILLRFQLFDECEGCNEFLIDFPTKYVVLALLSSASYGFATYLGITPPFKRKSNGGATKT